MENPWDDIDELQPEMENPVKIVKELFTPIYEKTNEKVIYKLDQVNFFPEEVKYKQIPHPRKVMKEIVAIAAPSYDYVQKEPHPDFGYDPNRTKARQYFRYRLLLSPVTNETIEFELFKFKFPLLFIYPVQFFIDKENFAGLINLINDNNKDQHIEANNEQELQNIIATIIRSDSTIKLIKRLMAL